MVVPAHLVDFKSGLFLFPIIRIPRVNSSQGGGFSDLTHARVGLGKQQQKLVEDFFEVAVRMSNSILRRWRFSIREDELRSIVGVALCQAAIRFDAEKKVKFTTFLFNYLKGALSREVSSSFSRRNKFTSDEVLNDLEAQSDSCPHATVENRQLKVQLRKLLIGLPRHEREILSKHFNEGLTVAEVARSLGYSRGHISRVKSELLYYLGQQLKIH